MRCNSNRSLFHFPVRSYSSPFVQPGYSPADENPTPSPWALPAVPAPDFPEGTDPAL
jgi:hypothetical protein